MDQREDVFPGPFPGVLSRNLRPCWKAVKPRLAGARFRRLVIESSWSPKESTGPVDFFRCFSSSLRASTSSFSLASSPQNNPAACLADWCGFLPESGVVFATPGGGRLDLVGVCEEPGTFWHAGTACDPLHQGCWPAGRAAGRAQEG